MHRLIHRSAVVRRERFVLRAGEPSSQLKFTLRMEARGPTGPLVNALLAPALMPAAEDLANKIAAHVEGVAAKGK